MLVRSRSDSPRLWLQGRAASRHRAHRSLGRGSALRRAAAGNRHCQSTALKRADPRFICERFNIVLERVGAGAARHTLHRARGGYARSQETDPRKVAASLIGRISEKQRQEWVGGKPADWAMEAFALGRGDAYGLLPRPGSQGTYSLRLAYVVHSASRPRMSAPTQADGPSIGSIDGAGRADVATLFRKLA